MTRKKPTPETVRAHSPVEAISDRAFETIAAARRALLQLPKDTPELFYQPWGFPPFAERKKSFTMYYTDEFPQPHENGLTMPMRMPCLADLRQMAWFTWDGKFAVNLGGSWRTRCVLSFYPKDKKDSRSLDAVVLTAEHLGPVKQPEAAEGLAHATV